MITADLKEQACAAYVLTRYSSMHERMIANLCERTPGGKVYLLKPPEVAVDLSAGNLVFLEGASDVALKDN